MSRPADIMSPLAGGGVKFESLGKVGVFIRGNGLQKKDFAGSGVGCIHYGQVHTHYGVWTRKTISFVSPTLAKRLRLAHTGDLVIATTSEDDEAVGKAVAWLGSDKVAVSSDAYIYRHSLDPKFVAYFFQSDQFRSQKKKHITGTKVRRLSGDSLAKIRIPTPPIEIQREIVKVLDSFRELEAELEAELKARLKQYHYHRDALLSFTNADLSKQVVRRMTLSEISKSVSTGGTPLSTRADYYNGTIPWLRTQEVRFTDICDTAVKISEAGLAGSSAKWIPQNCVIVAISGATAGRSAVNKVPLTTNQHCCNFEIDASQANYRYVFHWLSREYENLKGEGRGARSDLNAEIIRRFPILVPSLEEQNRIAKILDQFDALVNDLTIGLPAELKARRKQYEHYRDRLLTFKETA